MFVIVVWRSNYREDDIVKIIGTFQTEEEAEEYRIRHDLGYGEVLPIETQ